MVGGGPDAPGEIWEETKLTANKAYDVLIQQGYDHDSIYYLSMETGNNYVDKPSLDFDLYYAINTWAADASQLLIYFVDHGEPDNFILFSDGNYSQKLSPSELDGWLDALQQTLPGPVNFNYDASASRALLSPSCGLLRKRDDARLPDRPDRCQWKRGDKMNRRI